MCYHQLWFGCTASDFRWKDSLYSNVHALLLHLSPGFPLDRVNKNLTEKKEVICGENALYNQKILQQVRTKLC